MLRPNFPDLRNLAIGDEGRSESAAIPPMAWKLPAYKMAYGWPPVVGTGCGSERKCRVLDMISSCLGRCLVEKCLQGFFKELEDI